MIYYHGTNVDIQRFEHRSKKDVGYFGKGFYFTDNLLVAKHYARIKAKAQGGTPTVIRVKLRMDNPLHLSLAQKNKGMTEAQAAAQTKRLQAAGYDSIICSPCGLADASEVVVFEPDQITVVEATVSSAFDNLKRSKLGSMLHLFDLESVHNALIDLEEEKQRLTFRHKQLMRIGAEKYAETAERASIRRRLDELKRDIPRVSAAKLELVKRHEKRGRLPKYAKTKVRSYWLAEAELHEQQLTKHIPRDDL